MMEEDGSHGGAEARSEVPIEKWQGLADALSRRTVELFNALAGLRSVVSAGGKGFADGLHIQVADRILAECPDHRNRAEEAARQLDLACRSDGPAEGTRESLETCACMLETYGPECFPANELGQVDFARVMLECTAAEIRAFLSASASPRETDHG